MKPRLAALALVLVAASAAPSRAETTPACWPAPQIESLTARFNDASSEVLALAAGGAALGAVVVPMVYPAAAAVVSATGIAVGTLVAATADVVASAGAAVAAAGTAASQAIHASGAVVTGLGSAAHGVATGAGTAGLALIGGVAGGAVGWWYGEQREGTAQPPR